MPFVAPVHAHQSAFGVVFRRAVSRSIAVFIALSLLAWSGLAHQARAQTYPSSLLNIIQAAPEGEWRRVNLNNFADVWTPSALRPLGAPYPSSIIEAWSSFAWDSSRAELWIFGGGHANYSGNDTYRWRASTQRWERASLPSDMVSMNIPNRSDYYQAIDGPDNAPIAAHTYDNNLYLPRVDRFITFGGGGYNHGGAFIKKSSSTTVRATGPYLFDPSRADANKVGGTTGSHVTRNGPYPEIVGGNMWSNRDLPANPQASALFPINHLNGSTAYAEENGKDVVYIAAMTGWATSPDLYRYVVNDVNNPLADTLTRVGSVWDGNPAADQSASAYDPVRKLFVRLGNAQVPIVYWDLSGVVGPNNRDIVAVPLVQGGTFDFDEARSFGLDFDPRRDAFLAWGGGGAVWELLPPGRSGTANWLFRKLATPQQAVPPVLPATHTGVLGKWKYASNLDAFVALEDFNAGNVWIYKPFGWQDPRGTNQPPAVTITSPVNNTAFTAPATITLAANASDPDGSVAKVEFFAGTTLLATVNAAPYAFVWNSAPAGTHVLTARATDNQNASTTSSPVNVVVSAPNASPTVALTSPGNNATFIAPATVNLSAMAADIDGAIAKVEFFAGTTLIHTATAAPYVYSWASVPAGSYALSARATDNLGAVTTSTTVNISVSMPNAPPTVTITSPATGMSFNTPATVNITTTAADADGSIAMVEFFAGSTLLGTATTVPYNFSWTNVGAGTYVLTARATDNLGAATTSAAVSVTVGAANVSPTVSITTPVSGMNFTAPASIGISASAADTDGSIVKVEFFEGTTLLGTVTAPPYNFAWTNVPPGSYTITARATDNLNAIATSAAVNVTVTGANAPPTVSLASPANGTNFTAPATIAMSATAADADGSVVQVEFLAGTTVLATLTSAPYAFNWTNVPVGAYALTARATDNQNAVTSSTVVNVTVGAANAPPTVSLTSPANGATFTAPATIALSANATDSDGSVARVEFLSGTTVLATVTSAPYTFNWTNVPAGNYSLSARAIDNQNAVTTSIAANVTVTAPNAPPTVSMTSPANGATFTAPATIVLSASAADSDGSITKVEFYAGASLIATVNSAPYTFNWTNVPTGLYALTARATDNRGATTTSASVTATVNAANAAPSVSLTSPANGATFTAPATIALSATAADSDGTIAKVEFRSGSTVLATVTAPPYSFSWTNVGAGSYALTARATDNQNAVTTSAPANITVATAVPSAPSGLTASGIARTSVTLSWTDTSTNETEFRVQRSTNGRGFNRIATVGANVTTYTVNGLSPNTTYYFRVVATNAAGASGPSNVVVVRTLP